MKTTALRDKLALGDPFEDSGVVRGRLTHELGAWDWVTWGFGRVLLRLGHLGFRACRVPSVYTWGFGRVLLRGKDAYGTAAV